MERIIKFLEDFGFSKKIINKILTHHAFINYSYESLYNRIDENISWLLQNGYSEEEIIKMINKSYRHLLTLSLEHMEKQKQLFLEIGYTNAEYLKILKMFPSILSIGTDNILEKINYFLDLGLTKEEFIKKSIISPTVFAYSMPRIKAKEQLFLSLGYTKKEYRQIIKTIFALIGYDEESLITKYNLLLSFGYSREEVIKMTTEFPALYSQSNESIYKKIELLKNLGLDKAVLRNPKNLMMSVNLIYARVEFLQESGILINEEYYSIIFSKNKIFRQRFGFTKEELLARYPYSEPKIKRSK